MKLRSTPQSEDALMIMSLVVSSPQIENSYPNSYPPTSHGTHWMDMHRLRRLHDSQYIMKNPFTNENSNLSNIFHNNIHRKKVESLKVRSTEEFLCQFAWLPCRFFRGRRQGRQPLNNDTILLVRLMLFSFLCREHSFSFRRGEAVCRMPSADDEPYIFSLQWDYGEHNQLSNTHQSLVLNGPLNGLFASCLLPNHSIDTPQSSCGILIRVL